MKDENILTLLHNNYKATDELLNCKWWQFTCSLFQIRY